jgi:hypothetical protein
LDAADWWFPYEYRFHVGVVEVALNSPEDLPAIGILLKQQQEDPYSPMITASLLIHAVNVKNEPLALVEFNKLRELAPKAKLTQSLMNLRH